MRWNCDVGGIGEGVREGAGEGGWGVIRGKRRLKHGERGKGGGEEGDDMRLMAYTGAWPCGECVCDHSMILILVSSILLRMFRPFSSTSSRLLCQEFEIRHARI